MFAFELIKSALTRDTSQLVVLMLSSTMAAALRSLVARSRHP